MSFSAKPSAKPVSPSPAISAPTWTPSVSSATTMPTEMMPKRATLASSCRMSCRSGSCRAARLITRYAIQPAMMNPISEASAPAAAVAYGSASAIQSSGFQVMAVLKNEAHRAKPAQLLRVQYGAALDDLKSAGGDPQFIIVASDVSTDALGAPVTPHGEIGGNLHDVARLPHDPDVADQAPRARRRVFGVRIAVRQALHARRQARTVVGDDEQRAAMIGIRRIVRRHVIAGIRRTQRQPFVQPPFIEQRGFVKQEFFYLC